MASWWDRDIVETGKEPLLLCLLAFMVTFLVTRTIVRLIRAGRGPFRNVSAGGLHVHHVVPGTILLITGGLLAIGAAPHAPWRDIAGVVFGMGAALVLDEFALILHLEDVYWLQAGRASVTAVLLTAGIMGCVLLGFSPLGVNDVRGQEWAVRMVVVGYIAAGLAAVITSLLKGKYGMALLGVFVLPLALVGSVRLARPNSPWDHWFYARRPEKADRATRREQLMPPKVVRVRTRVENLLAGAPTVDPSTGGPAASDPAPAAGIRATDRP